MRRGLRERHFLQLTTAEVRRSTAKEFQQSDPWEIGVALGVFAKTFGARAPLNWVSHELFHDCVWVKIIDDDVARLKYAPGCTEIVGFQFFYDLEGGIDDTLYDWWLRDIDFFRDYEEFKEWRDITEDRITWDLIEFWETWHDVDCDGTVKELSAKEELAYDKARNNLSVKHEIERAAIEAEAVKLGL
ncbi:hypothetical protein G7Y89_g12571 [Cudoniella acicularis]|uniref:Uncharacterized protein n=1 Tax=Cudoniella acicularis TaxID=354080 RepID=A0A8H4R8V8_9HELO|nr:hypothetical protein G7Y89_g12571 [Cudoniella acicularis]